MSEIIDALDILTKYPHIEEYIKTYNNPCGFMFPNSLSEQDFILDSQMNELLSGGHSGASWGSLLRGIQSVLNGVNTREKILIQIAKQKKLEKSIKYNPITKELEYPPEEQRAKMEECSTTE